eukprot:gene5175-7020_t
MGLSSPVLVAVLALVLYLLFALPVKEYTVHTEGAILVTGTSTGIGRHAAIALAKKGFTVFAAVRKEEDAESLRAEGIDDLVPIILDVTKQEHIEAAVETVKQSDKNLIGLVNNAGISSRAPLEAYDMPRIRSMFEVNVFGTIAVTQAFLPMLRESKGRIVNIGSIAGLIAMPGSSIYSATKFALEGLTDSLRREMADFGVSVSMVEPGYVATAIVSKSTGPASSLQWASKDMKTVYQNFFANFDEKRLKAEAKADGPKVTTKAIIHALTNKHPDTRYVVANTYGVPAKITAFIGWAFPDRVTDFFLNIESSLSGTDNK